jgi:glycosyltransferase involved in cell wall biosynthesis
MKDADPLVSIGVPTFNRPDGLALTLAAIVNQTYRNIEVIVSDNGSDIPKVREVAESFAATDLRIKYIRQPTNIGPGPNFRFVLDAANAQYFIWAADDDVWGSDDFLEKLMAFAPANVLTFPEAVVVHSESSHHPLLKVYAPCQTRADYTKAFIRSGWGHPVYGVYNLKLFYDSGLTFDTDNDLSYYGEGTFLHRLFLNGNAKFVSDVQIRFTPSVMPPLEKSLTDYFEYFKRSLKVYMQARIPDKDRLEFIDLLMANYLPHLGYLMEKGMEVDKLRTSLRTKKQTRFQRAVERVRRSIRLLITGRINAA